MRRHMKIAVGAAALTATVGAGAAVAATRLDPSRESQAVVNDAADQLGVEPSELTQALKDALKNRVDAAVDAGRLTEEQGEELKSRIDQGDVPLVGLGGPVFGFGPPGPSLRIDLEAAASYLGMSEASVHEALHDGTTLAQLARARDKSVHDLVDAMAEGASAEEKARIREFVNGEAPRPPRLDAGREVAPMHF
jgi:hypothetical protein